MILNSLAAMVLGYVFDLMFGDIDSAYSLTKLIDSLAGKFREKLKHRYVSSGEGQTLAGSLLLALMIVIFVAPTVLIIILAYKLYFVVGILVEGLFCFAAINEKKVNQFGSAILRSLRRGKPLAARRNLSKLTDEDVSGLREEGIAKLSVKAIAENTFENGVAPLFFIAIGGGIGGVIYHVINRTARAVRGEDKFLSLAPRGMNDVLGLIPARISAFLAVKDARLLALDFENAKKIWKRDGKNLHKINDSQTVAAFAGALDVEVVGNTYDDEPFIPAEHIGDPKKECDQSDIFYAQQLSYGTVFMAAVIFMAVRLAVGIIL